MTAAVITCHARRERADAQRRTWAQGEDVVFFVGGSEAERPDEVALPVGDGYGDLARKTREAMRWLRARGGFDAVLKVDDDTYVAMDRLRRAGLEGYDYAGNFRTRTGGYPHDYASGFAYLLSSWAVGLIADAPEPEDTMEDRWVGNTLGGIRGVRTADEKRFACTSYGVTEPKYLWGSPIGKTHIALAEYSPDKFEGLHYWYRRTFPNGRTLLPA